MSKGNLDLLGSPAPGAHLALPDTLGNQAQENQDFMANQALLGPLAFLALASPESQVFRARQG